MKKTILLSICLYLCAILSFNTYAQSVPSITINVTNAGTLSSLIADSKKNLITNLIVTGNLNGSDIRYIREMAGVDYKGIATKGKLVNLDLSGAAIVSGGNPYYVGDASYYTYTTGSKYDGSYYYEGVGPYMFSATKLTSILLPNNITNIGWNAFSNCTGLTSFSFPTNLRTISESAFEGCTGFTSITIPNSVKSIEGYAFRYCDGLTAVNIPAKVTSINGSAFALCHNLEKFTVVESNTKYSDVDGVLCSKDQTVLSAFPYRKANDYTIPEGITTIAEKAFIYCSNLKSITIPNSVTSIGSSAFLGCDSLEFVSIPNSVTSLRSHVFEGCTQLISVLLSNSLKGIDEGSFANCKSLVSVEIPNPATYIGVSAFSGCTELSSIYFYENIKSIGSSAFSGCKNLSEIHSSRLIPPVCGTQSFASVSTTNCKIEVPEGAYSAYWMAPVWGDFANILEKEGEISSDTTFTITTSFNSNLGEVLVNNKNSTSLSISKNKDVVFSILPITGYVIQSATLNGIDITKEIADSCYTTQATSNLLLVVTFSKQPLYLTIKHADNGSLTQLVERGSQYTFTIQPSENWLINMVTFNGVDVTSKLDANNQYTTSAITKNSELNISFESVSVGTSISNTEINNLKVYSEQGNLIIEGIETSTQISIYTEGGSLLKTLVTEDNKVSISLPQNQVYIVKLNDNVYKILL